VTQLINPFEKRERLSSIFETIGEVFFASVFIGPIVSSDSNFSILGVGVFLSLACWYFSLVIAKS